VKPLQTALATGAALVALAFALCTYERWLARRRRHELAWSGALLLFALASAALAAGAATGWNGPLFRLFYLFGAIANVPFLALGTVYLLGGARRGDRWALAIALFVAFAAGVVAVAPLRAPVPLGRLPQGSDVFGPLPRVLAVVGSGVAAVVVFGGAALSAWRFRRGRMMLANVLIAAGTLITGASGVFNSVLDEMEAFAVALVVGIVVIFAGFLVATGDTATDGRAQPPTREPPSGDHRPRPAGHRRARRRVLPPSPRGISSATTTDDGHL
jgi:hypothetical protein